MHIKNLGELQALVERRDLYRGMIQQHQIEGKICLIGGPEDEVFIEAANPDDWEKIGKIDYELYTDIQQALRQACELISAQIAALLGVEEVADAAV